MENWRKIDKYPQYLISSEGKVYSLNKKRLVGSNSGNGYKCIDHTYIHTLVALAFPEICGEYKEGLEVDHINTIKTDNRAENLRWVTRCENRNNPISAQHFIEARRGIPAWNKGIPLTDECKRKKSESLKGRHWRLENGVRVWES